MDTRKPVGNPTPPSPLREGHFAESHDRRDHFPDIYRRNERESAYRGRRSSVYGRRPGDVRGPRDGGPVLHGRGTFATPVNPLYESRAAAWLTLDAARRRAAQRDAARATVARWAPTRPVPAGPDAVRRGAAQRRAAERDDTEAQDTVAGLFGQSDPYETDEFPAPALSYGSDRPRWTRVEPSLVGTIYRSSIATATFEPPEIEDGARRGLRRLGSRGDRPPPRRSRRIRTTHRRSPAWAKLFIVLGVLIMMAGVGAMVVM